MLRKIQIRRSAAPGSSGAALRLVILISSLMLVGIGDAEGQDLARFFELERPGHFTLRLFEADYGAEKYGATHEGFELSQSITHQVSFVGRAIAYQIYKGTGFDSPLSPSPHSAVRNFGRFEGGLSLMPLLGTTFAFLGGEDVGDSDAPIFENDFSSWIWLQSGHPVNFAYSTSHYFENGVTNGLMDLRMVAFSTGRWMALMGAGGAILGRRHGWSSQGPGRG
jgi:hypothetical protein